jgi:SPP1 gp7 family putative phage head morphogenesis protein
MSTSNKNLPTIRASAQARLLLYRLFSSQLGDTRQKLLSAPITMWDKILNELEKSIIANFENRSNRPTLTDAFLLMEKSSRRDLERQFVRLAGDKLWLGVFPQGLLDAFVKEHIQLIKDVRMEHLNKIASSLQRGLRQGLLQKDIAKDIQAVTNLSKKRSRLIARNAPLQYSGALTRHHQTSAGIKKYRWQASQDERVRKSHGDRNNKTYNWNGPGPYPRSEVNCRCDAVPILY